MLATLSYSSPSPPSPSQLIKDVGVAPKNFEAYISTCILARAMKLLLQALQLRIYYPV